MLRRPFILLAILSTLAGCDQLGLESASAFFTAGPSVGTTASILFSRM